MGNKASWIAAALLEVPTLFFHIGHGVRRARLTDTWNSKSGTGSSINSRQQQQWKQKMQVQLQYL